MVENVANAGAVESALGTPWCPVTALAAAEHLLGAVEPAPGTLFLDLVAYSTPIRPPIPRSFGH